MPKINYIDLVEALGGELVSLQPMRAKESGGESPGRYIIMELRGQEVRLDPPLIEAIDSAIKNAGDNG